MKRSAAEPAELIVIDSDTEEACVVIGDTSDEDETPSPVAAAAKNCPICFGEEEDMISFACGHSLCRDCGETFLRGKVEEAVVGQRLKCFSVDPPCDKRLKPADVRRAFGKLKGGAVLWQKWQERQLEATPGVANCPRPGCTFRFLRVPGRRGFKCPACKRGSCMECGLLWHKGLTCAAARERSADKGMDAYVARSNLVKCPHCGA